MAIQPKPKRKGLTKSIERKVLLEAHGECPWCEKPVIPAEAEIHHIDGDRSNRAFENLVLTCRNHHGQIEAQLIPHWEVVLKKQLLSNPSVMERLKQSSKPSTPPAVQIVGGDNHGIAAQNVNIETLRMPRRHATARREITAGLIEADPDMRTYANYLVKRYIDWRKKSFPIDGRRFSPAAAHGILAEGFGSATSVLLIPQKRFVEWVKQAQAKIDRTTFGKINRKSSRNYHSWDEHLAERRGT